MTAPPLPEEIKASDLDREVRAELRSLPSPVADRVARHLVAAGELVDEAPEQALLHAMAARRLAPRIAAVREAVGLTAYQAGEWQHAVADLRTYHRMSGRQSHLAVLADCERALGRPERAIDLYRDGQRGELEAAAATELLIVAAGARGDLGQQEAALRMLEVPELTAAAPQPGLARLRYAYADALLAVGRPEEARDWFAQAADVDEEAETDAAERMLELDGVTLAEAPTDEDVVEGDVAHENLMGESSEFDSDEGTSDIEDIEGAEDAEDFEDAGIDLVAEGHADSGEEAGAEVPATDWPESPAVVLRPVSANPVFTEPADAPEAQSGQAQSEQAQSEQAPASPGRLLDAYDLVILDLDGVVLVGEQAIPAAAAAIATLRRDGPPVVFATNNASRSASAVAELLTKVGVPAEPAEVITSAMVAADALAEAVPAGSEVLVVGSDALAKEVRRVGLRPVASAEDQPRAVIQGYAPSVGWGLLAEASVAIRAGARWVVTNADATLPSPRGPLPGNGSLVAALRTALGREPDMVVGKPQPALFTAAACQRAAESPLVVGDRLDTDIAGAYRAGMDSLLVLTGIASRADAFAAPAEQRPRYLGDDLGALTRPGEQLIRD